MLSDIYMDQYKQSVRWLPFASPGYFNVSKYYECKGGMIYDTEDGRLCHAKAPFPSEIPFADLFCGAGGFTQGMLCSSKSTHKRKRDCDTPNTMKFSAALMVDSNKDALETAQANVDKEQFYVDSRFPRMKRKIGACEIPPKLCIQSMDLV